MLHAIARAVSSTFNDCQLTYKKREPIDVALARAQHGAYVQALESLGVTVTTLPARDEFPDAVFVEDAAIVLDEIAVVTTPGTPSRAGEGEAIADVLAKFRPIHRITSPGTLDGGDVVRIEKAIYVGRSTRSNDAGIAQLRAIVAPFGYTVTAVPMNGALHLKTACTYAGRGTLLANRAWVEASMFKGVAILPAAEAWGASVLEVNRTLVMPSSYPKTKALLERAGFKTWAIDLSELQKAEGGPTCLSLIFETSGP